MLTFYLDFITKNNNSLNFLSVRMVSILVCISYIGQQCSFTVRNSNLILYKIIFVCRQNRRTVQRGVRIKLYLN